MNFDLPFAIPNYASGAELRKLRNTYKVSLVDLARIMQAARSYVVAIEERRYLRRCTIRRYVVALYCFVSVRKTAATQQSKRDSSNSEKTDAITTHSS
jgi:predicted transcriptional regulator